MYGNMILTLVHLHSIRGDKCINKYQWQIKSQQFNAAKKTQKIFSFLSFPYPLLSIPTLPRPSVPYSCSKHTKHFISIIPLFSSPRISKAGPSAWQEELLVLLTSPSPIPPVLNLQPESESPRELVDQISGHHHEFWLSHLGCVCACYVASAVSNSV